MWTATLGKILTLDNLRRRRVIVVNWCCMSKWSGESLDHLLLHCEVSKDLWSAIFILFGVQWVKPETVIELLDYWRGQVGSRLVLAVWRIASLCLMWIIWREWNARCFEDREKSKEEFKNILVKSVFI